MSELIDRVLHDKEWQALAAAASYAHPNGFDKLVLLRPSLGRLEVRLHVWTTPQRATAMEHVHNHGWDFSTRIITGGYRARTFFEDSNGSSYFAYLIQPLLGGGGFTARAAGRRRIRAVADMRINAGDHYWMHRSVLHHVGEPVRPLTSSLVIRGPSSGPATQVLSTRRLSTERIRRDSVFSVEELRERLEAFAEFLKPKASNATTDQTQERAMA